jgi:hypothetical protein
MGVYVATGPRVQRALRGRIAGPQGSDGDLFLACGRRLRLRIVGPRDERERISGRLWFRDPALLAMPGVREAVRALELIRDGLEAPAAADKPAAARAAPAVDRSEAGAEEADDLRDLFGSSSGEEDGGAPAGDAGKAGGGRRRASDDGGRRPKKKRKGASAGIAKLFLRGGLGSRVSGLLTPLMSFRDSFPSVGSDRDLRCSRSKPFLCLSPLCVYPSVRSPPHVPIRPQQRCPVCTASFAIFCIRNRPLHPRGPVCDAPGRNMDRPIHRASQRPRMLRTDAAPPEELEERLERKGAAAMGRDVERILREQLEREEARTDMRAIWRVLAAANSGALARARLHPNRIALLQSCARLAL